MNIKLFKEKLTNSAYTLTFKETMNVIDAFYTFAPSAFKNGKITNKKNENNGSCKLFAFAQMQNFSKEETLACFGEFYREDVLDNPEGDDHQNIRNFITFGWDGIQFENTVLTEK